MGPVDPPSTSSFHRDLSSTVVSLFLAVALALGVYFLVRRRTQWMRERLQARRAMMMGNTDEHGPHSPPTGESAAMVASGGPPPVYYRILSDQRASAAGDGGDGALYDISGLPPPPAYNDVIKMPPAYMDNRSQQTSRPQTAQTVETTVAEESTHSDPESAASDPTDGNWPSSAGVSAEPEHAGCQGAVGQGEPQREHEAKTVHSPSSPRTQTEDRAGVSTARETGSSPDNGHSAAHT